CEKRAPHRSRAAARRRPLPRAWGPPRPWPTARIRGPRRRGPWWAIRCRWPGQADAPRARGWGVGLAAQVGHGGAVLERDEAVAQALRQVDRAAVRVVQQHGVPVAER